MVLGIVPKLLYVYLLLCSDFIKMLVLAKFSIHSRNVNIERRKYTVSKQYRFFL